MALPRFALVCGLALAAACTIFQRPQIAGVCPTRAAGEAAIAMPDSYSAGVAEQISCLGGNAIDMAVAAAFALAVTYPEAGNIGGGGFMMIYMNHEATFLDYREVAPAAADRDMYLDEHGDVIPGLSLYGDLAVGVPGTVAGLWAAHQRYGSLPWALLLAPAIELARDGFVVPGELAARVRQAAPQLSGRTNFEQYFAGLVAGQIFRQPALAATLERIAAQGREGFYNGETATSIAAEMSRGGGLITRADLESYEPVWRAPLRVAWHKRELLAAPLPSSGGIGLIQLLKMKQDLSPLFDGVELNSAQYVHLIAEIEKRVFADRAQYLGDPRFVDAPVAELIDDDYLAKRAAEIDPVNISKLDAVRPGIESPDTTHFSILDQWGNAVSNTYTLNTSFGSGVVVDGAGFLLNNEMDDFSAKPDVPNFFGALGGAANAIAPGKRMLSSMSPTILLDGGEVGLVLGTPGGTTIFTTVFQIISDIVDFGMGAQEGANATRFHHQLVPADEIYYTPVHPLTAEVMAELRIRGYRLIPWDFIGDVQVIRHAGNEIDAGSDERGRGESWVFDDEALRRAMAARQRAVAR